MEIEGPSNFTICDLTNKGGDPLKYTREHPGQYVLLQDEKVKFFKTENGLVRHLQKEYGSIKRAEWIAGVAEVCWSKLPMSVGQYNYLRKQPFFAAKQ